MTAPDAALPVFVVNLERKPERRAFALNHVRSHGFTPTVWTAVDGRALDVFELERTGVYRDAVAHEKFSRSLSPAEIGCSLSHVRLYEHIVERAIPITLVLEDDAMLADGFGPKLQALIRALPSSWDLVQLIYACPDFEPIDGSVVRFRMKTGLPAASAGYLVTLLGAKKLLTEAYPIHYPADSFIGRSPRWGVEVYGAQPQLVTINNLFPSDIAAIRTLKSRVATTVKELFVRLLR